MTTQLSGMGEICTYVRRSETTVLGWIRDLGFPAKKLSGKMWESDKELIDKWRLRQLEATDTDPMETPPPAAKGIRRKPGNPKQQGARQ